MLKPSQINNPYWHTFLATAEYTTYVKGMAAQTLPEGARGYLRRNDHNQRYLQVLAKTPKGTIAAWYIKDTEADTLLTVLKIAPNQERPEQHWINYWRSPVLG